MRICARGNPRSIFGKSRPCGIRPYIPQPNTIVESYEVLREAFDKVSPKEVADALGVSLSLVYKWAQPPAAGENSGGLANPLDRVEDLLRVTRYAGIIKWLCLHAGGYFVKNPSRTGERRELVPATNEILQQFADLLGAITDAAADHRISPEETQLIRRHWDELKSITEGFVRACEDGDFNKLEGVTGARTLRR